jgi:hypothetical protein
VTLPSRYRRSLLLTAAGVPLAMAGCASPRIEDHAAELPLLDLKRYFDGTLVAHGLFADRFGRVQRRFIVDMRCRWQGAAGEFDERFRYADGAREQRIWRLRDEGGGRFSGRADDVVGEARGESAGNTFRWAYTLRLPIEGRIWEVQFDDWMHLVDEQVLLNRATMSKFGVKLGEVLIVFRRVAAGLEPGKT